ncbi:MAG: helix-turn-helix domain-containing protein [Phaeodactylibacter sp.]|nr:helix-turn-helix domain-containing protein [Phaeodactylibacter sp.]MCB9297375.1 helix-turn-helix domain-containing protein [Lewinellaceae bacterium]
MSQQKLAEQLGLKRNNIASYEAGIVEPKAANFLKLAFFLGVSPEGLLEEDISASFPAAARHANNSRPALEELHEHLALFSGQTADLQKVSEGFREFQKIIPSPALPRRGQENGADKTAGEPDTDLSNLLDITEQLLDSNWKLIRALTSRATEQDSTQ